MLEILAHIFKWIFYGISLLCIMITMYFIYPIFNYFEKHIEEHHYWEDYMMYYLLKIIFAPIMLFAGVLGTMGE